uniref:Retrotransposon Copia-like N-terminal domain-containing protein n=1 Tax=Cannabis sativa TaxID=3483 RepID=A0A803PCU8_CANSA
MSRKSNMVSERSFPPLMANVVTNSGNGFQAQQGNGSNTQAQPTGNTSNLNPWNVNQRSRGGEDQSPVFFNHTLSIKLNDHNYLLWRQQVLAAIRGNRMTNYIQENSAPPQFLTDEDQEAYNVNPDYSTLETIDLLASIGEVLSIRDHVAAIFKGLPSEYDTFVISTNTRIESYSVAEIEALLLASESRIEKNDKELDLNVNMAYTELEFPEANYTNTNQNLRAVYPRFNGSQFPYNGYNNSGSYFPQYNFGQPRSTQVRFNNSSSGPSPPPRFSNQRGGFTGNRGG